MITPHSNAYGLPKNLLAFLLLALLPAAALVHGSLAFWSEHFELNLLGTTFIREGIAAQSYALVTTSLGWMALWMLSPLVGMPKRGAFAMGSLAALWMLLFFAMSA